MSFTLAHPAAIIPLCRKNRYFHKIGLILGSMAPDFEYFLHLKPYATIGHNCLGFLIINLPLCFVIYYLYINFIQYSFSLLAIENVKLISQKTIAYSNFIKTNNKIVFLDKKSSLKIKVINTIKFTLSALIGMFTHVFWDSFTHINGYFVKNIAMLNVKILNRIPIYKVLQHGGTIIGFSIIVFILYKIGFRIKLKKLKLNPKKIALSICIALLIFLGFLIKADMHIANLVIIFCNTLFIMSVIIGYFYRKIIEKRLE